MFFNNRFKERLDYYETLLLALERRIDKQDNIIFNLRFKLEKDNTSTPIKKGFQPSPAKLVDRRQVINRTTEPSYPSCNDTLLQSAIVASSYSSNDSYSTSCDSSSYDSSSSSCDSSYSSSDY